MTTNLLDRAKHAAADGNELRDGKTRPAKFCASYSSSALAVNTFAPFKTHSGGIDAYKRHRLEVEDFARRVQGCDTTFISISSACSSSPSPLSSGASSAGLTYHPHLSQSA